LGIVDALGVFTVTNAIAWNIERVDDAQLTFDDLLLT
jgi:hypothetical protein